MVYKFPSKDLREALRETAQNHAIGAALGLAVLLLTPPFLRNCFLLALAVIFLAKIFAIPVMKLRPRRRVSSKGKAVFISGCDSGFGYGTAQVLDDLGFQVFAGCLFPDGEGAIKLRKSCSSRLHVFELDVTKEDSVNQAADYVKDHLGENKLWAVVNNAGINDGGELLWTNMDILMRVMDVNTFGVVRVTKAFLSELVKNQGRVITLASAAGRNVFPGMVPYCMSKHAAVSFTEGLRMEMYNFGVKVVSIEPWMYKTGITDEETTLQLIHKTWAKAPEEIKQLHVPGYIEKFKRKTIKAIMFSIKKNPSEVVSCIEEAVTAECPRYSYGPGTVYYRVTSWFLNNFPRPLVNFVILNALEERGRADF